MTSCSAQKTTADATQLRSFGLLMGGVFLLIGFWPLVIHDQPLRLWAAAIGGIFAILGLVWPIILREPHRIWMVIGEKLGWINSRIILGIMFFGIFTPVALFMSLLGKSPLQLRYDAKAETYRVLKEPRDPKHVLKPF